MNKHVHSKDPRKNEIVKKLRLASGGNRVTLLREIEPGVFRGHCLRVTHTRKVNKRCREYESVGYHVVTLGAQKSDGAGYYHSLEDSFDNPQIVLHDPGGFKGLLPGIEHGPYESFQSAKLDMIASIKSDIANLKYLLENVRRLKEPKEEA